VTAVKGVATFSDLSLDESGMARAELRALVEK
jgi:hypothetical protein